MTFQSILDKVDQYIKIKPWLQFVGYILAFGGLIGVSSANSHMAHLVAVGVAYVGLGVSMAGWLYNAIYQ